MVTDSAEIKFKTDIIVNFEGDFLSEILIPAKMSTPAWGASCLSRRETGTQAVQESLFFWIVLRNNRRV